MSHRMTMLRNEPFDPIVAPPSARRRRPSVVLTEVVSSEPSGDPQPQPRGPTANAAPDPSREPTPRS